MPFVGRLREAVGLGSAGTAGTVVRASSPGTAAGAGTTAALGVCEAPAGLGGADAPAAGTQRAKPLFKQYREADGSFRFKLVAHGGEVLLESDGFAQGREAGAWVKRLKSEGSAALAALPAGWRRGADGAALAAALDALAADA